MRAVMVVLCILGLLGLPDFTYAGSRLAAEPVQKASEKWKQLDQYAEQIYRASVAGEIEKIQQAVQAMGKLFTETTFNDVTGVEGVRALSDAIVQVKRKLPSIQLKQEELMSATARLRLATDALTNSKQPMWLQYEQVLRDDMARLLATDNKREWIPYANRWLEHIDRIRPAATIQRDVQTIEMMESLSQLIRESIMGKHSPKEANQVLNKYGDSVLIQLFGSSKANPTLGPLAYTPMPFQWIFMLAFIVCMMLAYVGFQKYRYEQYAIRPGNFRNSKR
ncbi:sporulation protein YpjB [Paenibacillus popilliae]|uniref:Sporulation protein n=1 Tax=Paenibacillus popilliae TaxID=78057 RepID=A0ABY3B1X3_PAEPP|nr:sporulation protein YpjB [Paenibacillus sp. SDF0028]TQR46851.1 sporulation protein [Paenibacillus sp. SDF0028]